MAMDPSRRLRNETARVCVNITTRRRDSAQNALEAATIAAHSMAATYVLTNLGIAYLLFTSYYQIIGFSVGLSL